jgi:hypothetical protein
MSQVKGFALIWNIGMLASVSESLRLGENSGKMGSGLRLGEDNGMKNKRWSMNF